MFVKAMDTQDCRKTIRWQIDADALLKLEGSRDFSNCRIKDINYKGLRVCFSEQLMLERPLKFNVVLSDNFSLDIESRVVWSRSVAGLNIYGLFFTRIKDRDKEKIYQFVRKFSPEELNKQWWKG